MHQYIADFKSSLLLEMAALAAGGARHSATTLICRLCGAHFELDRPETIVLIS
jgi:hypothetical protein